MENFKGKVIGELIVTDDKRIEIVPSADLLIVQCKPNECVFISVAQVTSSTSHPNNTKQWLQCKFCGKVKE